MLRKGSICMEDMHSTAEAIIQQLKLSRAITKKLVETCIVYQYLQEIPKKVLFQISKELNRGPSPLSI